MEGPEEKERKERERRRKGGRCKGGKTDIGGERGDIS